MIHIALVEDDLQDRERLKRCLKKYEEEKQVRFEISEFSDGEDIIENYTASYDLILMDIEMAFMNGMRAAQRIREMDPKVGIIFITNMPQYAIQGYKVNALDYVLKPISWFSFSESMSKAIRCLSVPEKTYITIASKGGRIRVDVSSICYVEVLDHDLIYHMTDGILQTKGTLRDAAAQLDEKQFFACNRCYLVNLDYVDGYQDNCVLINRQQLAISRGRKKNFLNALNERMNKDQA